MAAMIPAATRDSQKAKAGAKGRPGPYDEIHQLIRRGSSSRASVCADGDKRVRPEVEDPAPPYYEDCI